MAAGDDDLWRVLHEVEAMPYGAGQIAAVEQLIRRADAAGDPHLAFAVRMLGTNAYVYGGEPARSFVTFSWCLADLDRSPQPYHARHLGYLLWHFKYMVNALLNFPDIPLDRTYAVLDDMERRYRENGQSLQAVYKNRHRVARHIGASTEAEEWYRRWLTTPRDDLSDCAGCDPTTQVAHLASLGRDEEAVALAAPVLLGGLSCSEQPQAILTSLLLPYLRTGRRDEARDAHRQAYRRIRGNLADLWEIGDHVEFCALTGNEPRGLEIVERHLDWLDRAPSPAAAMRFAAAAALVMRRLVACGEGGLTVHRRAYGDRPAGEVPLGALADELAELATGLAARFDARNGTSAQSEWIAGRLTAEPIGDYLPLSASIRRRIAAPGATTGMGPDGQGGAGEPVRAGDPPGAEPVEVPADATADELLCLAEEMWRTHRPGGMTQVLRAYDERFGAAELPARTRAHRVELRAAELGEADDLPGAVAASREALARYRELPDPVRAEAVAGRLGVLLCASGAADEGLPMVRTAAEFLAGQDDPVIRARGYDRLASALAQQERWAEALEAADLVDGDAAGDPYLAVRVAVHRAHILEQLDRPAEFRAAAEQARQLSRELGAGEYVTAANLAYARAVADPAEAVAACDEALRVAPPGALLPARVTRARALLNADRPAEAVEDFVEAVALCVERGAEGAALLRWELANAYRLADRLAEAAEVAEEAIAELDRSGRQGDADRCRHLLAGIYHALDEPDAALGMLDQLAANLDGPDNLPARGQVLEEAAALLYDLDRDAAAAQRFAAAAQAYRLAGLAVDELRARRREVLALFWAGDESAAVEAVTRADAVAAPLVDPAAEEPALVWELAMLADAAARVLAGLERLPEAYDRLTGVPERLRSIEAFGEAAQVELLVGELLLRMGRPGEAEALLRPVLGGLPTNSAPVTRAAALLAWALAELGRTTEAEAVRAEYGLNDGD